MNRENTVANLYKELDERLQEFILSQLDLPG